MDLIYIILSIYLKLFRTALPLSRSSANSFDRRGNSQQAWAVWIPVVGWVSVLVRFVPHASFLAWRVTSVERLLGQPPSVQDRWADRSKKNDVTRDASDDRSAFATVPDFDRIR